MSITHSALFARLKYDCRLNNLDIRLDIGVTKYDSRYNKGIHISEFAVYDVFVSKHKITHMSLKYITLRSQSQLLGAFRQNSETLLTGCVNFFTWRQVDRVVDISMKSLGIVISLQKELIFISTNKAH